MNKKIFSFIVIFIIIFVVYFVYSLKKIKGNVVTGEGEITEISKSAKVVTIVNNKNTIWSIALEKQTILLNEEGKEITINDLYPTFIIKFEGREIPETDGDDVAAISIKVIKAPKIIILYPKNNDQVPNIPFTVKGYANVKDDNLSYKINDKNNGVIQIRDIQSANYGYFEKEIFLSKQEISGTNPNITIDFFEDVENGEKLTVNFIISSTKRVYIYFGNSKLNPEMIDCTRVYPVEREILILSNPGDLIKLLVNGPFEAELAEGYFTTIPKDVVLNDIGLNNGIIKVDFSNLDSGGSCRVGAIRAQITETLKQIYGVKEVIISVDGNVEEALQP